MYGVIRRKALEHYCKEMSKRQGLSIKACESAKEAVEQADIIVTTTRGRERSCSKGMGKIGTHIAAIGSDMPDKQELDTDLFPGAKVVDDSIAFCLKNGETHHAVEEGVIPESAIYGEIGEILLGEKPGRENDEEITIFDTVGMAIQDNVMASAIYKQALEKGLGIKFDFLK